MKAHAHRTGPIPDWQKIKPENQNFWQQTAAATKGIITPGNIASFLGLALVLWGIMDIVADETLQGLTKIATGRILDLVDGAVAEKTGTKSPLGEATDASVDKFELAVGLPILVQQNLLPWPVALIIAAQNIANVVLTIIAKRRRNEMHPSHQGKLTTVIQWSALALYVLSAALDQNSAETVLILAHLTSALFVAMGIVATSGYVRDAFVKSEAA